MPRIPLIEDITAEPIPAGHNIIVVFDPGSEWYNASITIAAGWLKTGGTVSYNVAAQPAGNVRTQLGRLGLGVKELEDNNKLRFIDWYSATIGQKSSEKYPAPSLKVADLSIVYGRAIIGGTSSPYPGSEWRLGPDVLRVGEEASFYFRFNDEKSAVEFMLTRNFPVASARKSTLIVGLIRGIHSEWVYNSLEAAADGILDVRLEDTSGELRNMIRIRRMRNLHFRAGWHPLSIGPNFEIALAGLAKR